MGRKRGFTLHWAGLRITAERDAKRWKASVYDLSSGVFIFERQENGPDDAKRVAVTFAVSHLFNNSDGFQPELLSQMLPWKWAG
jgi:hypothetical protein